MASVIPEARLDDLMVPSGLKLYVYRERMIGLRAVVITVNIVVGK